MSRKVQKFNLDEEIKELNGKLEQNFMKLKRTGLIPKDAIFTPLSILPKLSPSPKFKQNWDDWTIQQLEQYIRREKRRFKKQETINIIKNKVLRIAQNLALIIRTDTDDLMFIQNMITSILQKLKELNIENKSIGELITLNKNNRRKEFRERKEQIENVKNKLQLSQRKRTKEDIINDEIKERKFDYDINIKEIKDDSYHKKEKTKQRINVSDDILFRGENAEAKSFIDLTNHLKESQDEEIETTVIGKNATHPTFSEGIIWIYDVENKSEYIKKLGKHKYEPNIKEQNVEDPVYDYYLNKFESLENIKEYFNNVIYPQEKKPFKVQLIFGVIETGILRKDITITFPDEVNVNTVAPVIVRNEETKQLFNKYIDALIDTYIHNQIGRQSGKITVGLCCVKFHIYRLKPVGIFDSELLKYFVNSNYFKVPKNLDNFCFDAVAVMLLYPNLKQKDVFTKAHRLAYIRIYDKEPNTRSPEYKKFIREYVGFDMTNEEEMKRYQDYYKLNVNIYSYDFDTKEYNLESENVVNDNYQLISILIINNHAIPMNQHKIQETTRFLICPKCKQIICRYNLKKAHESFNKHVEKCNGEFTKTLQLDKVSLPYCPHILKNPIYLHCLAKGIEYEPIKYYITFDFETMEEPIDEKVGKATILNSRLYPLSVASTIKSKENVKTIYYDVRNGSDFIKQWINQLFIEAERIAGDIFSNKSEFLKDNLPTVPVIGFNSSKFDINVMLPFIDTTIIKSFLGSSSSFKQLLLKNDKVILKFIDARLLAGGSDLKGFVSSFGSEGCTNEGMFPYEAINTENYNEVLNKTEPFKQEDFNSYLNQSKLSDEMYKVYLEDYKNFKNRWDYLQHYNELDTQIMISPIDNIIKFNWEYNIDALRNLSLSSNASAIKYALCYRDLISFHFSKIYDCGNFNSKIGNF